MRTSLFKSLLLVLTGVLGPYFGGISTIMAGQTYTSPETASPIFALQGEYVGEVEAWDGKWGAQVIAISEEKLSVHLLKGGLPGEGFSDREPSKTLEATMEEKGALAEAAGDDFSVTIEPDSLVLKNQSGEPIGQLSKVTRQSRTMGSKPSRATVLFDGRDVESFENGKMSSEGFLESGCTSRDAFDDHILHIEFRTPFQPDASGQARGNSGVYIQGRYELQVLDSFGLRGEDNECGGIYQIARPKLNMAYPPLSWQTYDIDFTAAKYGPDGKEATMARVTIKHNGVTIHDDIDLPRETPGKDSEAKGPGQLYLQDHGNPVVFRNIWVMPKSPSLPLQPLNRKAGGAINAD